ncbi:MAG: TlpA family protein disulfide reductase [Alphaproteobacteria bacterium]|nr:TlpA family protein disulfide reductase [Alphaproteobacteria bacterium]
MNRRHFLSLAASFLGVAASRRSWSKPMQGLLRHNMPQPIPALSFQNAKNETIELASFMGRKILLNLWASWCLPCLTELPSLDRLKAKADSKELVVLALSLDLKGLPAAMAAYRRLNIQHLDLHTDSSRNAGEILKIPYLPTTLLIDSAGRETARMRGAYDWDSLESMRLLKQF